MTSNGESPTARAIAEFRANGGKLGGSFEGVPVLLLHTPRTDSDVDWVTPLTCQPLSQAWAIFASKAGATTDPEWYRNLLAHPQTTIEFGSETVAVTARVVEGAERDEIWTRQKQLRPSFAEYEKIAGRTIPVVVLERR